jgi:hypothetical protein
MVKDLFSITQTPIEPAVAGNRFRYKRIEKSERTKKIKKIKEAKSKNEII